MKDVLSPQVITEDNQLALATVEQTGPIVATGGATDLTCLVETDNGKQLAYKTYILGGGGGTILTPTLTWYTGNTGTTLTILDTSNADLVEVFKNGMLLQETEDYTISGTTLTLATALEATDKIAVKLNDMSSADLQAIEALLHNVNSGTN